LTDADVARRLLDGLGVPEWLERVRDFVWRGGEIVALDRAARAGYVLVARWEHPVFEADHTAARAGLVAPGTSTVDGRWVRAMREYRLEVGVDLRAPVGILVEGRPGPRSVVPLLRRSEQQVRASLDQALTGYTEAFLDHEASVPEAIAADEARLRQLRV
jgi:hypothetical protein